MASLTHMGVFTDRPAEMEQFYRRVLGLVVSDSGVGNHFKRRITFMTGHREHHHQFVLVEREPGDPPGGALFQASFEVGTLEEVRHILARARGAGVTDFSPLSHGNSWSVYFQDPDGNMVEIYTDTGWYVPQPFGDPLDLSLADSELIAINDERLRQVPGAKPLAEWVEEIGRRIEEAQV